MVLRPFCRWKLRSHHIDCLLQQIFLLHPPSMLRRRLSELEALDERRLRALQHLDIYRARMARLSLLETLRLESATAFFLAVSLFFVLPLVTIIPLLF
jgi:hypothetical protein